METAGRAQIHQTMPLELKGGGNWPSARSACAGRLPLLHTQRGSCEIGACQDGRGLLDQGNDSSKREKREAGYGPDAPQVVSFISSPVKSHSREI